MVDWCAGAGGKTLALAAMMDNRGQIVACDVSAPRLDGAVRRLRRAGRAQCRTPSDRRPATNGRSGAPAAFDRVLVDAPCTGTGTWRRNPDARQRLTERDLSELVPKQASILDSAPRWFARAGVWSTLRAPCSQRRMRRRCPPFSSRHPDFRSVPAGRGLARWTAPVPATGDFLSLTPARHGTDGFFAAVLERAA